MHYANGREAKVGDQVVGKDYLGRIVSGTLVAIAPGQQSCNGAVIPAQQVWNTGSITIGEYMHVDDAVTFPEPKPAA